VPYHSNTDCWQQEYGHLSLRLQSTRFFDEAERRGQLRFIVTGIGSVCDGFRPVLCVAYSVSTDWGREGFRPAIRGSRSPARCGVKAH
jgi:hypothetical protein